MTLDALEALEAAATPAPWEHREHSDAHAMAAPGGWVFDGDNNDGGDREAADYALTAAARNALPALIAVARAAERFRAIESQNPYSQSAYLAAKRALDEALAALR